MSELTFRRASTDDVMLLDVMSNAPHVFPSLGTDQPWDWPREVEASWQEVWIIDLSATTKPIGVVVVLDAAADPSGYWGEVSPGTYAIDIWISDASQLRKGYGTVIMKHAIDRCFHVHNAHTILIDPLAKNEGAIAFYQHLGFEVIGPRTFGADECIVLRLRRPDSGRD
ncbi:MAG: GNAT family N-acetyltransferase [Candidatus Nanopelagicales bacterium]